MRIAILALSGALLSGCSLLGVSDGLFGTSGSNSGYYGCSTNYSGQTSSAYSDVHTQYVSAPSSCHSSHAQTTTYQPTVTHSSAGTAYNTQSYTPSSTYPSSGTSYHVENGYTGQHSGFNPVLGAAALGGIPALRGQYGPRNRASKFYGNAGLNWYDVDTEAFGGQLRTGFQATRHFGAEIEGSVGFNDDDDLNGGVDYSVGAFLVNRAPISPRVDLVSRVGYYYANLDGGLDADDIAYGVGAEYALSQRDGVRVDYTRYEGLDADSVAVSYARKF